jgi:Retrotransposon gag protein
VPLRDEAEEFRRLFDSFGRLGLPKFSGEGRYEVAEEWLACAKANFHICRAPEANQVELTTHYLENSARLWWDGVKDSFKGDPQKIPWEWFQTRFTRQYMSVIEKERLRTQFMTLRQKDKRVSEYNTMFLNLARYAPNIRGDPYCYRRHYINGLRPQIAAIVDNPLMQDRRELMSYAEIVETHHKRVVEFQ